MSEEYERTYFEIWGEMPPTPKEVPADDEPDEPAAVPAAAPVVQLSARPTRQPVKAPVRESPEAELDRRANEVIQRMMVDTLRRIESRLARLDEDPPRSNSAAAPAEVLELCENLTKMSDEIGRFLERTRRINEELAGLQIESAKNLEAIARKLKELEGRPLHWPPR
ncbi:MAG TPA: hypothetical protein VEU28_08720 [Actinomycetota bacterium]|nr:hypothetical protein [Actinomycetota bacterium]